MASITELLSRSQEGQADAVQQLYAQLYPEIKRVARARLASAGGVTGLNTTALVHEGFLRMAEQAGLQGGSRGQFFAYVGQVLRSVVIDHLRSQGRDKRGGDQVMVTLSAAELVPAAQSSATDLIAIDRALVGMRELDPALYELLEMLSFAGLTIAEVAELRGVSSRTINRDLIKARGLLHALLGEAD
ncbi:MAG: sigma-70 family RNA polymerase sigma factor [Ideonella sp.]|nr:sigma-70 family RNA polymerase sigma factor [Ideonella sp.]MBL0150391.1 sigma-70 family RNA polymerase sigma factor [Ideonella sp.]